MGDYTVAGKELDWGGQTYRVGETVNINDSHPRLAVMLATRQLISGAEAFTLGSPGVDVEGAVEAEPVAVSESEPGPTLYVPRPRRSNVRTSG